MHQLCTSLHKYACTCTAVRRSPTCEWRRRPPCRHVCRAAEMKTNVSAEAGLWDMPAAASPNWVPVCTFIVLGCFFYLSCLNYTLIDMFNTCAATSRCTWREVSDKLNPALTNMQKHLQINTVGGTGGWWGGGEPVPKWSFFEGSQIFRCVFH